METHFWTNNLSCCVDDKYFFIRRYDICGPLQLGHRIMNGELCLSQTGTVVTLGGRSSSCFCPGCPGLQSSCSAEDRHTERCWVELQYRHQWCPILSQGPEKSHIHQTKGWLVCKSNGHKVQIKEVPFQHDSWLFVWGGHQGLTVLGVKLFCLIHIPENLVFITSHQRKTEIPPLSVGVTLRSSDTNGWAKEVVLLLSTISLVGNVNRNARACEVGWSTVWVYCFPSLTLACLDKQSQLLQKPRERVRKLRRPGCYNRKYRGLSRKYPRILTMKAEESNRRWPHLWMGIFPTLTFTQIDPRMLTNAYRKLSNRHPLKCVNLEY